MREVVLDASVVLTWFDPQGGRYVEGARAIRELFESGQLVVVAPRLLELEVLNVAARRWSWDERALVKLVATLRAFRFDIRDPQIERVAGWAARGLSAYDATYVSLAEAEGIELITDDDLILDVATGVASRLSAG